MNPAFDPYKYGLLIAGMPDVLAEAFCGGPEFQQTVTEDDVGDVAQTHAVTIVKAGGNAAVVLKPAIFVGERRYVAAQRAVTVKAPEGEKIHDQTEVQLAVSDIVFSFIWLGAAFGWARFA